MASLLCSGDNNLRLSQVYFDLNLRNSFKKQEQEWYSYEIVLHIGNETKSFLSHDLSTEKIGLFAFNLNPSNELNHMLKQLSNFIKSPKQKNFFFEPADPSFELRIERSHFEQFKVYLWLDAGNTKRLEYTWDAEGIRFMTTTENIKAFIYDLKEEI